MASTIKELVERYKANRSSYKLTDYQEAEARADFIDKFFKLLGWDMFNELALSQQYREIIRETRVEVDDNIKKPDYEFRLGSQRQFFVEAKAPSVDIISPRQKAAAFQVRRYGWSAGLPISILTNFEHLVIYDTTIEPNKNDASDKAILFTFEMEKYEEQFDKIYQLISKEAVKSDPFEERFPELKQNRDRKSIDNVFLSILKEWRVKLANDVLKSNRAVPSEVINDAVQSFILRILFLRMCEDKGIETYEALSKVAAKNSWSSFKNLFHDAGLKYNSDLFDSEKDYFLGSPLIVLNSETVSSIIDDLYYPKAPYSFAVIAPEFLGKVYEDFLQEEIVVDEAVELQPKRENKNRETVSTPPELINRVVNKTLERACENLTVNEIYNLRILDPASGSGGFLIAAFEYLVSRVTELLEKAGQYSSLVETVNGFTLPFNTKKKLLQNCLFGVDRDYQAVQTTRFSLLIKLIENETEQSVMGLKKLLPSLERNIVYGDSLIDDALYNYGLEVDNLNGSPLNWNKDIAKFPFDVVIGNPPYLYTEAMQDVEPEEFKFYKRHYKSAYKQFDKYFFFLERAIKHLAKPDGFIGFVLSSKFMTIEAGRKLREIIADGQHLLEIIDFGTSQLFTGRSTYICLLFLSKKPVPVSASTIQYESVSKPKEWLGISEGNFSNKWSIPRKYVDTDDAWLLPSTDAEHKLLEQLNSNTKPLGELLDVFNGIQTSANAVYVLTRWKLLNGCVQFSDKAGGTQEIEEGILKPFYDGNVKPLKSFYPLPETALVIFPYNVTWNTKTSQYDASVIPAEEMKRLYPKAHKYLSEYKDKLAERNISPKKFPPDEWYRYGRSQALAVFNQRPKIVVGVNSLGDKYVYDDTDTILASGGTAGEVAIAHYRKESDRTLYSLYFILAVLNHTATEYYCRKRGSGFEGGYFARGSAILSTIPIPVIDFTDINSNRYKLYSNVDRVCRNICQMYNELETHVLAQTRRIELQRQIDHQKLQLFNDISALYGIEDYIDNIELPQ